MVLISDQRTNELENKYQEITTLKKELKQKNNEIEKLNKSLEISNENFQKIIEYKKDGYKKSNNICIEDKTIDFQIYKNKIKCLYHFKNFVNFRTEIYRLYDIKRWKILDTPYRERAEAIKDYDYYIKVKEDFKKAKLTNWPLNDEQLISYFDTLKLIYKVLDSIEDETIKENLQIIMEYTIQENEKERIDYMIVNNQKIALIECGKKTSFNDKTTEKDKENQVNQYKERLEKSIGHNEKIKIAAYTLTYVADNKSTIEGNTLNTCKHLANNLERFFKDDKNAIQILNEIKEV